MAKSDIRLKHKVQLRRKVEGTEVSANDDGIEPKTSPTPNETKSKSWLWILLGGIKSKSGLWILLGVIVIIGVIVYMLLSNPDDKAVETQEREVVAVEEVPMPTDTTVVEGTDVRDVATDNDDEVANTPKLQRPDIVETPSTIDKPSNVSTSTSANTTSVSNDVEAEAMKVIRGDYGVGQERKDKLGTKYQTIQSRVNELKREGIF